MAGRARDDADPDDVEPAREHDDLKFRDRQSYEFALVSVAAALDVRDGVVLTAAGQAFSGGLDPRALVAPFPGPGHVPTFPGTLPLAVATCTVMLELTLVGERWPLRRLPALGAELRADPLTLAVSTLLVALALLAGLSALARAFLFTRVGATDWVAHASLNALTVSIILHVGVGRRWPFA